MVGTRNRVRASIGPTWLYLCVSVRERTICVYRCTFSMWDRRRVEEPRRANKVHQSRLVPQ